MAEAMGRAREREREENQKLRACVGVSMCVCARLCLCLRVCLCACVFMFVSLNVYAKVCGIAHEAGSYKYTPCVYIYVHAYSACANTTPIFFFG